VAASGCASIASVKQYVRGLLQDEPPPRSQEVNPQPPQYAPATEQTEPASREDVAAVESAAPAVQQASRFIDLPAAPFIDLPAAPARVTATPLPPPPAPQPAARAPLVDFGGQPLRGDGWALAQVFTPKQSRFALIASAQASEPALGCADDTRPDAPPAAALPSPPNSPPQPATIFPA